MKKLIWISIITVIIIPTIIAILLVRNIQINKSTNIDILIANICTLILAIFTIINVIISKGQLLEAKRDVDLGSKPLPWISDINLYIETPNVWVLPGKNPDARIYSRYGLSLKIKNIGNHPAVGIDIRSKLSLLDITDANLYEMKCIDSNFSKIEAGEEIDLSSFIPLDYENLFLHSFSGKTKSNGVLEIDILFRNYLGKPFLVEFAYYINADEKKHELINQLSDKVISIKNKNSSTIEEINELIKFKKNYRTLYDSLKDKIKYNPDVKFVTDLIEIPGKAAMKELSKKEYNKIRMKLDYYKVAKGNHLCSRALINNGFEKTYMGKRYINKLIRKKRKNDCY